MYGEVVKTEQLTPSLVRVILGGAGLDEFEPIEFTDQYVNALFVPDGAPYTVPFEPDEARALAPEHRPRGRRYTVRWWDPSDRTMAIDFVAHGDAGYAGPWAQRAVPGDRLQMIGPAGAYRPSETCDWHLMVGDESALPAIAASLEAVRPGVPVVVIAVVDDPECELVLESPGDVRTTWVHRRAAPGDHDALPRAVAAATFPDGTADVFVHGEAGEIRAVRRHLLAERGIEGASISPYWRRNHTDEAWREVKREWMDEMRRDT